MSLTIRAARARDRDQLVEVWERSARATHHFLQEGDIRSLRPLVAEELAGDAVAWWVLVSSHDGALAGFLGFAQDRIEGLFIDPDYQRQGGGRLLVDHAESLRSGPLLCVDVNEQNASARNFYEALGFMLADRSATDSDGRPFPILHMQRPAGFRKT